MGLYAGRSISPIGSHPRHAVSVIHADTLSRGLEEGGPMFAAPGLERLRRSPG
jgi:hypothetical protein